MSITCTVQITQLNGEISTTQLRFDSIEAATVDAVKTQLGVPIRKKKDKDRDGAESIDSMGTSNGSVNVTSPIDDDTTNKNTRLKIWNPSLEKYFLFKDMDLVNLLHDKNGGEMTKFKFVKKKSKKGKEGKEGKETKKKHKRTQSRDESRKDKSKDGTPKKEKESKEHKEKDPHKEPKDKDSKKSSAWKGPMFGINLSEVIEKQQSFLHNKSLVPLILFEISSYIRQRGGLKEEGLFRVSGAAQQVDDLKKLYDRKGSVDLNAQAPTIHSAASLLKQFFRELPEPLFPRRYYSTLIKVSKNPNAESKLSNLKLIVTKLPRINRHSLLYLLKFLKEVANHSDTNKMTPTNIGTVWGPNLIKEPPTEEPVNLANFTQLMDSEHVNSLICSMLEHLETFEALKDDEDSTEVSTPIPPEHAPPPIVQGPGPSLSMPAPQLYVREPPTLTTPSHGGNSEEKQKLPVPNDQQLKIKKELLQNVALKKTIVTFDVGSTVRAKFDYAAQGVKMSNGDTDISLKRGQEATVLENCPGGWIKVELEGTDPKIVGCVPCNYVTTATSPKYATVGTTTTPLKPPTALSPAEKRKSYIAPEPKPAEPQQVTDFRSVLKKSERPAKPADAEPKPEPQPSHPPLKATQRPHSNTTNSQLGPRHLAKAHSFVLHNQTGVASQPQSPTTKPPVRPNSFAQPESAPPSPHPLQAQSALQPPPVVEKALNPPPSPQKQNSMSSLPTTDQLSGHSDWREATTSEGKKYYYNKRTRQTSWVVPEELLKVASQASLPPPIIVTPAASPAPKPVEAAVPASPAKTPVQPVESAPAVLSSTSASDWKTATAPNGKMYYYNTKTKETSWTKPEEKAKEETLPKSFSTSSLGELQKKLEEEELELQKEEDDGKVPNISPHNDNATSKSDIESLEEEEERIRIEEQLLELEREEKMMMQQEDHESESEEESSEDVSDEEDDAEEERRIEELKRKIEEEEARIQEEQRKIQERKAQLLEEERKIREQAQRQKKKASKTRTDEELPELPPPEDN